MKQKFACILICLLVQGSLAISSEIRIATDSIEERSTLLILEGEIEDGDFAKFKAAVDAQNAKGIVVSGIILNSPGGSVVSGLQIGRYIRQKRLVTYSPSSCIENTCICASACALIWLGGIARTGIVYVHRPSLRDNGLRLQFDDWEQSIDQAQDEIDFYLREMRIPETVSEAMLSTNPSDIAPIEAGKDVPQTDPLLVDYSRKRCGPPLSDVQTVYLEILESDGVENIEADFGWSGVELLNALREKAAWLQECSGDVLFMAQQEAQLVR